MESMQFGTGIMVATTTRVSSLTDGAMIMATEGTPMKERSACRRTYELLEKIKRFLKREPDTLTIRTLMWARRKSPGHPTAVPPPQSGLTDSLRRSCRCHKKLARPMNSVRLFYSGNLIFGKHSIAGRYD